MPPKKKDPQAGDETGGDALVSQKRVSKPVIRMRSRDLTQPSKHSPEGGRPAKPRGRKPNSRQEAHVWTLKTLPTLLTVWNLSLEVYVVVVSPIIVCLEHVESFSSAHRSC